MKQNCLNTNFTQGIHTVHRQTIRKFLGFKPIKNEICFLIAFIITVARLVTKWFPVVLWNLNVIPIVINPFCTMLMCRPIVCFLYICHRNLRNTWKLVLRKTN